jgi:predicted RNase H-like nuclease (RuvC/YqgF family)
MSSDRQNAGGHLLEGKTRRTISQNGVELCLQADLERELERLSAEKSALKIELMESKSTGEEKEKVLREELESLRDQMKRDLRAKDRQIESLEEQLRRSTKVELKKLKRGTFTTVYCFVALCFIGWCFHNTGLISFSWGTWYFMHFVNTILEQHLIISIQVFFSSPAN